MFPSLTPFQVRKEKAKEVFLLIRRIKNKNAKPEKKVEKKKKLVYADTASNWY